MAKESCIGNITLCQRKDSLYLRYFTFHDRFQASLNPHKREKIRRSPLKEHVSEFLNSLTPEKKQGIYAYVTVKANTEVSSFLKSELIQHVRSEIGPIASPDFIQFSNNLPKTRSGKIMRRILRKIAEDNFDNLGDVSTLSEPEVIDELIKNRQNRK